MVRLSNFHQTPTSIQLQLKTSYSIKDHKTYFVSIELHGQRTIELEILPSVNPIFFLASILNKLFHKIQWLFFSITIQSKKTEQLALIAKLLHAKPVWFIIRCEIAQFVYSFSLTPIHVQKMCLKKVSALWAISMNHFLSARLSFVIAKE